MTVGSSPTSFRLQIGVATRHYNVRHSLKIDPPWTSPADLHPTEGCCCNQGEIAFSGDMTCSHQTAKACHEFCSQRGRLPDGRLGHYSQPGRSGHARPPRLGTGTRWAPLAWHLLPQLTETCMPRKGLLQTDASLRPDPTCARLSIVYRPPESF